MICSFWGVVAKFFVIQRTQSTYSMTKDTFFKLYFNNLQYMLVYSIKRILHVNLFDNFSCIIKELKDTPSLNFNDLAYFDL